MHPPAQEQQKQEDPRGHWPHSLKCYIPELYSSVRNGSVTQLPEKKKKKKRKLRSRSSVSAGAMENRWPATAANFC